MNGLYSQTFTVQSSSDIAEYNIEKIENYPQGSYIADEKGNKKAVNDNLTDDSQLTIGYHVNKGIRLQSFVSLSDAAPFIIKGERRLSHIINRKHFKFTWGRYDFIIIRKNDVVEMLQLFEQKVSASKLLSIRLQILVRNLFLHSTTTLLVTT